MVLRLRIQESSPTTVIKYDLISVFVLGSLFKTFVIRGEGTNTLTVIWEKKDYGEVLGNATLIYKAVAVGNCEVIANPVENRL